jgi:energy-coupling factor transport system substrate-specific component
VPARILAKTDILSVTEMQLLHRHPSYSRLTLEGLKGFDEISLWVGAHHERPDGKGYPEMLTATSLPLESRHIHCRHAWPSVDRPYRKR